MKLNKLGNSDLLLSQIGLGTWAIGGGDWEMGWESRRTGIHSAIIEALEQGINWIDTAHAYGFGVSEEAVGKATREWNADEIIVATKCGVLPQEDNKPRRFISSSTIGRRWRGRSGVWGATGLTFTKFTGLTLWRIWPNLGDLARTAKGGQNSLGRGLQLLERRTRAA